MDIEVSNIAIVKEIWLIVECPHCHRPQIINKYVRYNTQEELEIVAEIEVRERYCTICSKPYKLKLKGRTYAS